MLNSDEKAKVEKYINKISEGIYKESQKFIQNGMSDKKVIERVFSIQYEKKAPLCNSLSEYLDICIARNCK